MELTIRFLKENELTPELKKSNHELDNLAFAEDQEDPLLSSIEWSSPDWIALGFIGTNLVSQLCLVKREILVDEQPICVAGVGGVATHPQWQKRGLASQLLRASEVFIRDTIGVPFGLLICADQTQPVYEHCGWKSVAHSLDYIQKGEYKSFDTCVMALPLTVQAWPAGRINLCGSPW